jgi:hypothetical protein
MDTKALIEKAEKGDAHSQLKLGQILLAEGYPANISDAAVYWLEKAADRPTDVIPIIAMKELVQVYLLYAGADARYVLDRMGKFVKRLNPIAMLELGRIFYYDKSSPYWKKFGSAILPGKRKEKNDKDFGFALIDEAANIAEQLKENNPFDSAHYYILTEIFIDRARTEKHYLGVKNKQFQSLLDRQLFFAKKACDWIKANYAAKEHKEDCAALLTYARRLREEYKL